MERITSGIEGLGQEVLEELMARVGISEQKISKLAGVKRWKLIVRPKDNYTVAMLQTGGRLISLGVAKRNPTCDPLRPLTGAKLAIRRALEEAKELSEGK